MNGSPVDCHRLRKSRSIASDLNIDQELTFNKTQIQL